ncbi:DUF4465 domain-containing protein [Marinilabilia rubra]|uniref:Aggregation factor core protein MAFp3, isoform E n=1 Tax=Marinilabilia rubra TaxID=2162893 RepID=A0A2U2BCD8_9BACT|nr:DUF4465 domain-containing protein [Marinilabilia rubra]PWE00729.1 aggregation factor core protein MAFp3, isoform E [Marinilabilia rubra]
MFKTILKGNGLSSIGKILAFSVVFGACSDQKKNIPPPEIFLAGEGNEIEVSLGDTIKLEPRITYNFDASYQWEKNGEILNTNEQFLLDSATQLGSIEYLFRVTTPNGADSMTIPVDVIVLADFENLQLTEKTDTFWIGETAIDGFTHREVFFPNNYQNNETWQGFGYSNIQSNSSEPESIQVFSTYNGVNSDNIFGLISQPNDAAEFIPTMQFSDDDDHELKSLEINNTNLAYYMLRFGTDDFERMGGSTSSDPDWCKVTLTGINSVGNITGKIQFYLADYRFENNKRDYIVKEWTEIDLSELNAVNKVQFSISSSRNNQDGEMITPEMFCIDNIKILN